MRMGESVDQSISKLKSVAHDLRGAGVTLIASGVAMIFDMLIGLALVRWLSPHEYGRVAYFLNLQAAALLLFGFGLAAKTVTDAANLGNDPEEIRQLGRVFYSLLTVRLATVFPLLGIGVALSLTTGDILYLVTSVCAVIYLLQLSLNALLQARQKTTAIAVILLLRPLVCLGLLITYRPATALGVFVMYGASFAITTITSALLNFRMRIVVQPRREFVSAEYIKRSIGFVGQFSLAWIAESIYTSYAILLLGNLAKFDDVAFLAVPLNLVQFFPTALTPALMATYYPQMCSLVDQKDKTRAAETLTLFYRALATVALVQASVFAVYPRLIIELIYTVKYADTIPLLMLLSPFAFILPVARFLMLTLVAYKGTLRALYVLVARLVLFGLAAGAILKWSSIHTLTLFVSAYDLSCLTILVVELWVLKRLSGHMLPLDKTVIVALFTMTLALASKYLLPNGSNELLSDGYKAALTVVIGGLGGLGVFFHSKRPGDTPRVRRYVKRALCQEEH